MNKIRIKILKNKLEDLYLNQELSMAKIAELFNTNAVTIYNRL